VQYEPSRNSRLVIWRANVATRSSCIPGAETENLRRADETLVSECKDLGLVPRLEIDRGKVGARKLCI